MYIIKVILFIQNKNFVVKCIFEGGSISFVIYLGVIFGRRVVLKSGIAHLKYFRITLYTHISPGKTTKLSSYGTSYYSVRHEISTP